jgi:hypothetical protein
MQITYVGTQQDFVDGQKTHLWRRYSRRALMVRRILWPILGVVLTVVGVVDYQFNSRIGWSVGFNLFEIMFGLYMILADAVIAPLQLKRAYRRRLTAEPREHTLTIDQDRIESDSPGRSHATLEWELAKGMVESRTSILIYFSAATFLIIPKRVLSDAQQAEMNALLGVCRA